MGEGEGGWDGEESTVDPQAAARSVAASVVTSTTARRTPSRPTGGPAAGLRGGRPVGFRTVTAASHSPFRWRHDMQCREGMTGSAELGRVNRRSVTGGRFRRNL
jgi:hypothetical protein